MEIKIPYNFSPREYQKPLWNCLKNWYKRAIAKWHRRAGKDKTLFNLMIKEAVKEKWVYWYLFPTYAQAKKVIWDWIDKNWFKFLDHIPKELVKSQNKTDLSIELINWSLIQLIWTDKFDSIRWVTLKGCIFSEFAFQNPIVWDVIRPILAESWWWAIFNSTPNWKNHFYDLYNLALKNEKWFVESLSISETWVVSEEIIEEDRKSWMSEEMIEQEYYCSFDVWAIWSYYAKQIQEAKNSWRITEIPKNKFARVDIFIDIWVNDSFALWFKQNDGLFYNFIRYFEDNWRQLDYYFNYIDEFLEEENLSLWKIHIPHDGNNKSHSFLVSGLTILDKFKKKYWTEKIKLVERPKSVSDWIDSVRAILNKCRFDEKNCNYWIKCLESYKKKYDEVKKVFLDKPFHDWASHWADAFRYFAIVEGKEKKEKKFKKVVYTNYEGYL